MEKELNRSAKDKVFKDLLKRQENLAQFYYDLTGKRINPEDIIYNTITTSLVTGKEEDIAFQVGTRYIILFEAQSTWSNKDIIRFAVYICLLFVNFIQENEEEVFNNVKVPEVEAYVIYTGKRELPEVVSLDDLLSEDQNSMLNPKMKITTAENATGLVKEYIDFSQLETEYYINNKRDRNDVIELIDYCIKNNILKQYMLEHKKEVANMIENFFTEEKRIKWLINDAVEEAVNKANHENQQKLEKAQEESREAQEINKKNQEEIERLKARIKELENN